MRVRSLIVPAAVLALAVGLGACALLPGRSPEPDDWVVVRFESSDEFMPMDILDSLMDTELAADEALGAADAGWIDGNEIGDNVYELYFVGHDRAAMWAILEAVFAEAPVDWTEVELRDGLDDSSPTAMTRQA